MTCYKQALGSSVYSSMLLLNVLGTKEIDKVYFNLFYIIIIHSSSCLSKKIISHWVEVYVTSFEH